jgi:hypothetical protein
MDTKCRNCNKITLDKIKDKLIKLKTKINEKKHFRQQDNYFNSDFNIKCNTQICEQDLDFENYIKNIYLKYKERNEINKQLIKEEKVKTDNFIIEINKIINENPIDTDITEYYASIMDYETIKKLFGKNVTLKNNYLIKDKTDSYKIFLKKIKNEENGYYFNIKYFDNNKKSSDYEDELDIYYDRNYEVNKKGKWIEIYIDENDNRVEEEEDDEYYYE